jgi:hypothetical protein
VTGKKIRAHLLQPPLGEHLSLLCSVSPRIVSIEAVIFAVIQMEADL